MADNKPAVSFGFTKKVETKKLTASAVGEDIGDGKTETDFVLSLEENEVKSTVAKRKENEPYVIPLIKKNRWRGEAEKRFSDVKDLDPNDIDQQAAREVLEESAKYQESWEGRDKPDPNLAIPLLMQNKVPEGFETDDKLDVALRPDVPDDADYEQIPIEQFGFAMLRGMGWKEGQGIGKNGKVIVPVEAHLRPKGLGLGADRSQASNSKDNKKDAKVDEDGENMELKKGSYCVIVSGKHQDLYGVVEGIDEDNARLVIKLALSGQVVTLTQYAVKVVRKKEYSKYSKYLNKGKADSYKDKELKQNGHDKQSDSDHIDRRRDEGRSHKDEKHKNKEEESGRKRKHESRDGYHSKQYKSDSESSKSSHSGGSSASWLKPHLRVRIVDKNFKRGKYYKEKVVVLDLISRDNAICKTDDGKVLEGLSHSQLETVIPRSETAHVMLCSGDYKSQLGKIMKKDKDSCRALVQLLADRDVLVKVEFDDICEYVGSIDDEFDY
ncbi:G-patch domain and KOW motifs-containing protein-like [Babylonia areolata]|uniref:G-patch domain and KOW motifs-containing protein-like n=1 Tax=Babylonia areolata TaxID=304850 RepID=UPI003FD2ECB4